MATPGILEISFISLFLLAFLIQMIYYWGFFSRLAFKKMQAPDTPKENIPVSVVIAARNEYRHLSENLPVILEQDYPNFEVVVVNHASDDDSQELLKDFQKKYKHLKVVHIEKDLNFFKGKKFPLSLGIKSATHETLLLTDADCRPNSKSWIKTMAAQYQNKAQMVLGYGPYFTEKGLANRVVRYDTFMVALQYLSFALAGKPYMGVGRNLSYKKELFLKNKGFTSHYNLVSGDDDLFVSKVANKENTVVELAPDTFVYSEPKHSMGAWMTQKKRHLSTGSHYKSGTRFLLGLYGSSMALYYAALLAMIALLPLLNFWMIIPAAALVLRFFTRLLIHQKVLTRLHEKHLLLFSLWWEPVYILIIPLIAIRRSKSVQWK
ncbi:MAG: glycosyltransferase [Bacteroidales bacterium]|nr:glycosyltransferase [Bacteroidales bacterium]